MNPTSVQPTAAEQFSEFASQFELADVPSAVLDAASLHILDVLGCGLASVGVGLTPYADSVAASGGEGSAAAIGVPTPVEPAYAALANGIRCHALDYDDTHPASIAHVSAVVVPAAMAAAQDLDAHGKDLLAAIIAGNEVTCRIGRAVGDAFHVRGFHPTAICGVFGATAAVGKLRGLDGDELSNAFGIAGSMAGGLLAYLSDGSATKRVHPGWMAHGAHTAVALAANGATGPAAVLEGPHGIYEAFLGRTNLSAADICADLGARWETLAISFKPYPACHFLHAPLDAVSALRAEHDFGAGDVERVTVFHPEAGMELCAVPIERKRRPATPYESKFSTPFAVAVLIQTGELGPSSFDEPFLSDPDILALAAKVGCEERKFDSFPEALPGAVELTLSDGEELALEVPHQRGGTFNPMSADDVVGKYRRNATTALPAEQAATLEDAVLSLADRPGLEQFNVLAQASPVAVT